MSKRRGFTLVEAAISAALVGVLALGMGSAVLLTARAVPMKNPQADARSGVSTVLAQMCGELRYMTALRDSGGKNFEFAIADRSGDGVDEVICYEWSGNVLTRTYNNGTPVTLLSGVSNMVFTQSKAVTTATQATAGTATSGEVLFAKFNGWPLVLTPTTVNTSVTATSWAESSFTIDQVNIPANAAAVEITRLRVRMRQATTPNGATVSAGIYQIASKAKYPEPTTTRIGNTTTLPVTGLPAAAGWVDFPLSGVLIDPAVSEFNFVVKGTGSASGVIQSYYAALAAANSSTFLTSTDSGGKWLPSSNQQQNDALFEVWGTYSNPTAGQSTVDTWRLHAVTVSFDVGTPAVHAEASARTLNQPVVAP